MANLLTMRAGFARASQLRNSMMTCANYHPIMMRYIHLSQFTSSSKRDTGSSVSRNGCGIQLLPDDIWRQIFGADGSVRVTSQTVGAGIRDALEKFDLWGRTVDDIEEPPNFSLPEILGGNIENHFRSIGEKMGKPYQSLADEFAAQDIPEMPARFAFQPGWTRYNKDGSQDRVPCPTEDAFVFDVETTVTEGEFPTMAAAVSSAAWYTWVSKRLYTSASDPHVEISEYGCETDPKIQELIPLEDPSIEDKEIARLVVGHSVGYDRQRTLEQYQLKPTKTRFLDTMSMHMATSGLSSQQRFDWNAYKKVKSTMTEELEEWAEASSPASLASCYKLWCGKELSKEQRNLFVKGTMDEIREDFQTCMSYCCKDVESTFEVFTRAYPTFMESCTHPVSFAGMLEMGMAYLPVDESWKEYVHRAEETYNEYNDTVLKALEDLAETAVKKTESGEWKRDIFLRNLDWSYVPQQYTKPRYKKDGTYAKGGEPRPKKQHLAGYPAWYKKLWDSKQGRIVVTPRKIVAPLLLQLEWVPHKESGKSYPLCYCETNKWGFIAPIDDLLFLKNEVGLKPCDDWDPRDVELEKQNMFFKLPSQRGSVGTPFSKDFIPYINNGTLTSKHPIVKKALQNTSDCAYWQSARSRIKGQFVVWEDLVGKERLVNLSDAPQPKIESDRKLGVIVPAVIPSGTVTRRAVERTWLTASNPKKTRIGSELKSKVIAPPGYKLVGADVDSQELWIAAVLGDKTVKEHGGTPLGWMTLQGSKSDGTDMHSHTASILGITRDAAKIVNYGRIYGASEKYASALLTQFNDNMKTTEAENLAKELYKKTKGDRESLSKTTGKVWRNGSESAMFNALEVIATGSLPKTPVLDCHISQALQSSKISDKNRWLRSRINWVVQSSAVDYLHLMLVSMNHLCTVYDIDARFCIAIHDEVRYIVADEDTYRAAFALHITNLLVRAMFAKRLGLNDLPLAVAFFSAVDIDSVMRKEVTLDCVTPSNPEPVPPGETVDIYQAGERVNWKLER